MSYLEYQCLPYLNSAAGAVATFNFLVFVQLMEISLHRNPNLGPTWCPPSKVNWISQELVMVSELLVDYQGI